MGLGFGVLGFQASGLGFRFWGVRGLKIEVESLAVEGFRAGVWGFNVSEEYC